jgi:hypothetical protein
LESLKGRDHLEAPGMYMSFSCIHLKSVLKPLFEMHYINGAIKNIPYVLQECVKGSSHQIMLTVILICSCTEGCPKLSNGNVEIAGEGFCTSWIVSESGL